MTLCCQSRIIVSIHFNGTKKQFSMFSTLIFKNKNNTNVNAVTLAQITFRTIYVFQYCENAAAFSLLFINFAREKFSYQILSKDMFQRRRFLPQQGSTSP